jgi:hypothetical protein
VKFKVGQGLETPDRGIEDAAVPVGDGGGGGGRAVLLASAGFAAQDGNNSRDRRTPPEPLNETECSKCAVPAANVPLRVNTCDAINRSDGIVSEFMSKTLPAITALSAPRAETTG